MPRPKIVMKQCQLLGVVLIALVTGCGQSSARKILTNGYEEVTVSHSSFLGEPRRIRTRLEYRDRDKVVVIWPVVRSDVFIKDAVTVFVGDRSQKWSDFDRRWETGTHLFAVSKENIPVDITAELLSRWARESGKDVTQAVSAAGLIGGKRVSDEQLSFYFEFEGGLWPGVHILANWNQIVEAMRDVKTKGVQHKDPTFGIEYIE